MPKIKPRTRIHEKNKTATSKNAFYCYKSASNSPLLFSIAFLVNSSK